MLIIYYIYKESWLLIFILFVLLNLDHMFLIIFARIASVKKTPSDMLLVACFAKWQNETGSFNKDA